MTESSAHSVSKEIITRTVTEGNLTGPKIAYFLGSLVGAAFDITQIAFSTIMMAVARFPEAQATVLARLDPVVGWDVPPTFADWPSLMELQTFVFGVLWWRPVNLSVIGAPRRASKVRFNLWNCYCIPAGATVFGNHWSIARDPNVFPDLEIFNPKRWIGPDGNINSNMKAYSFVFGRRTCIESNLAIRPLYIAAVTVFWEFRIAEDPERPINDTGFVPGIVAHQMVFEPKMDPRNLREVMETGKLG